MPSSPHVGALLRLATAHRSTDDRDRVHEHVARMLHDADEALLDELAAAVAFHGVASYMYDLVRDTPGVSERLTERLRRQRDLAAFNHLHVITELSYLRDTLDPKGIPWLIFKGPTLAEPVHGSAHHRSYGDLDMLVQPRHLRDTVATLEESGCTLIDRNWTLILEEMKGEVHLLLPTGVPLDLHWHLFNEPRRREAFPVSIDALFDRARTVNVSGQEVPTLSLTDTVVYVAMHTLHSGGDRLIWLKDLDRLMRSEELDVPEIAERAREWHAELVLTSALARTELALGPVPNAEELRSCLRPSRMWLAAATLAWRRAPAERESGQGSLGRIVCRSTRPTQLVSFGELSRRLWARAREGNSPSVRRFAPDDPRSLQFASGGTETREEYFRRVSSAK